ncbi:MAG: NAD(P)-binding domain-containing protein [Xanthobacteraceae bacterium]
MTRVENIIVGAGPYGLSLAAHLRAKGIEALIIGKPMSSWRSHMPAGMVLKSEAFASCLSDPERANTVEAYFRSRGKAYRPAGNPFAMSDFIDYADWFRRQCAPDVLDAELIALRPAENGFELEMRGGRLFSAKRVILATGHVNFAYTPETLTHLPSALVSHTRDHSDLTHLAHLDVTIIGRGQSALETAALLHELGANVRVLARAPTVAWNSDPNAPHSFLSRLRNPEAGLGPGWYSLAISELPKAFFRLPLQTRDRIFRTGWGPSGAWWLKERVLGQIPLITSRTVAHATEKKGKVELILNAGSETIQTDHVIAATGYKVDLARLPFLDAQTRARIATFDGSPRLSPAFESTIPGLHFVGLASAQSFGPVMRFVYGAKHAATIMTHHVAAARPARVALPRPSATGAKPVTSEARR